MQLKCHPKSHSASIGGVSANVELAADHQLQVAFVVTADVACIELPEAVMPRFRHNLWQHTCFELFIATQTQSAYQEYNFSPSGEWAAYRFCDYRQGDGDLLMDDPAIVTQAGAELLTVSATLAIDALPSEQPWAIGLSAVIETNQGLSWWALNHLSSEPDFHSRDSFRMLLP